MTPTSSPLSKLAVLAVVCSFAIAPLGLILGIVALLRINDSRGALRGKGVAIAAIVLPLFVLPILYAAIDLRPTSNSPVGQAIGVANDGGFKCRSKQNEAKGNLKQLHKAEVAYRSANASYTSDLSAIGFEPKGVELRYRYAVVVADADDFRAEAIGNMNEVVGDVWAIDSKGKLTNVANACR